MPETNIAQAARVHTATGNLHRLGSLLAALLATGSIQAQIAASASFQLAQETSGGAATTSTSASFHLDGTLAQTSTEGEASSASFQLQSGFWTSGSTSYGLTVLAAGSGSGSLTGDGVACTANAGTTAGDCTETAAHGTMLTVTATPDSGHAFDGWSGCDTTSTTTLSDDTCTMQLLSDVTATATFTALASVGDRVWRDVDGDGVQDGGEPGIDDAIVELTGPSGDLSTVTSGGGIYGFADLYPGDYTVSVDPVTLPAGVVASFDADGMVSPHTAMASLTDGENRTGVDFGYQPQADLELTKDDSQDPLAGGQNLVYTMTVTNHGPAPATSVVVTDLLPTGTVLVATSGCAEDPVGVPACALGDLAVGAGASYTVEVSIEPAPPVAITNTASVAATESDPVPENNSDSEATGLDAGPPSVMRVDTIATTDDGELTECETVHAQPVGELLVQFDEAMADSGAFGGITDPASWLLVAAGADGSLATTGCDSVAGDDVAVALQAVTWDPVTTTARLQPSSDLVPALYRLIACGMGGSVLTDLAGNPLDGDGDGNGGDDFVRRFRVDSDNLLANGHFDCDLAAWVPVSNDTDEIVYAAEDADGSADSGSAAVVNLTNGTDFALGQCVTASGNVDQAIGVDVRVQTAAGELDVTTDCAFFAAAGCTGDSLAAATAAFLLDDTDGSWMRFEDAWITPADTVSVLCAVHLAAPDGADFDARIDRVELATRVVIFSDGFESVDQLRWNEAVELNQPSNTISRGYSR